MDTALSQAISNFTHNKEITMTPKMYQELASRTECVQRASLARMNCGSPQFAIGGTINNKLDFLIPIRVNHSTIGICGEIGEICELVHKYLYSHPPLMTQADARTQLILEVGDLMWYLAQGCNALTIDLTEVVDRTVTFVPSTSGPGPLMSEICILLSRESGRLTAELQRWIYYGKYPEPRNVITLYESLILIYRTLMGLVKAMLNLNDITLDHVMEANIAKLRVRYPDKYTDECAAEENRNRKMEDKVTLLHTTLTHVPESQITDEIRNLPLLESTVSEPNQFPNRESEIRDKEMKAMQEAVNSALPTLVYDEIKCQYCQRITRWRIVWKKGAFGKHGSVILPYCGACNLQAALADRGMTAPVKEGEDYTIQKPPV